MTTTVTFLNGTVVLFDPENISRYQYFDRVSLRSSDIDRNMFLYDGHLENPIWSQ